MIDKLPFFARCLEDGGTAQVHVLQTPGLDVPADVTMPAMLEYGWSLPIPIPDLRWTDQGIFATLSFNQTHYPTFVPWSSVVAIAPKGQGLIVAWEWTLPGAFQAEVDHRPAAPVEKKRGLSLVKNTP